MNSAELFKTVKIPKEKIALSYLDLNKDDIGNLIALSFNEKAYHSQLNKIHKDLRPFVYERVIADNYYLVFDENSGIIVGGFATTERGTLNGLFSLVKGIGHKLFELRLKYSLANVHHSVKQLYIFCIGEKLKNLYGDFGFIVAQTINWDDVKAPENWNYNRFGKPDLYIMIKEIK